MKASELYKYLDALYSPSLSQSWDNDGIMCMPCDRDIRRVLIALDVTPAVADTACREKYDLIISHHPMIFSPLKGIQNEKIISLIKNDICVFSFHTRLDTAPGGVNDTLADLLSLKNTSVFCEMGRTGELEEAIDFNDLIVMLKEKIGTESLGYVKNTDKVKKLTVLGGDGKDFWREANAVSDVYITGNMSYNSMLDAAEAGASVIEAGHFFTEFPVCRALEKAINAADSSIETKIIRDYPINTLI